MQKEVSEALLQVIDAMSWLEHVLRKAKEQEIEVSLPTNCGLEEDTLRYYAKTFGVKINGGSN